MEIRKLSSKPLTNTIYEKMYDDSFGMTMTAKESPTTQRIRLDRFLASIQNSGYRMAQLATSNTDDALELVQEAMLQLVKRYSDKPNEELKMLFYRILSSKITDWYRKKAFRNQFKAFFKKETYENGDPIQELAADNDLPISEQVENTQTMMNLVKALQKLSHRQHQVFLLRAWQGFNVKETAKIMGCSSGSVKTHYSRALQSLRTQLGDQDE
jgi:RNA polymerase sigma-70 factor (ECF subfamily)